MPSKAKNKDERGNGHLQHTMTKLLAASVLSLVETPCPIAKARNIVKRKIKLKIVQGVSEGSLVL